MHAQNDNDFVFQIDNLLIRKPRLSDVKDLLVVKNDNEAALLLGGVHKHYSEKDIEIWMVFHNTKDD